MALAAKAEQPALGPVLAVVLLDGGWRVDAVVDDISSERSVSLSPSPAPPQAASVMTNINAARTARTLPGLRALLAG